GTLQTLKNIHVQAEEYEGNVIFLHTIQDGPADKSYGIHVAKLADLPETLIERANTILEQLETNGLSHLPADTMTSEQLSFFAEDDASKQNEPFAKHEQIIKDLKQMDLFDMTPLEAMNALYRLQKNAKK